MDLLKVKKEEALNRAYISNINRSSLQSESKRIIKMLKKKEIDKITSEDILAVKKELLSEEDHEEKHFAKAN